MTRVEHAKHIQGTASVSLRHVSRASMKTRCCIQALAVEQRLATGYAMQQGDLKVCVMQDQHSEGFVNSTRTCVPTRGFRGRYFAACNGFAVPADLWNNTS